MAIENPVYVNEGGLPLNAIEWLETHHRSKLTEREQMLQDLQLPRGGCIVDAGCGPGLWTPLLARAIGPDGLIIGVDVSAEALMTAQKRSLGTEYQDQVSYQQSSLECLPVPHTSISTIFSANVSQYLPEPAQTFATLGHYLEPGGRLIVKDIDFGTMHFHTLDPCLQERVFLARAQWEQKRPAEGFPFEDSWVGSKLAAYFRAAGYEQVEEKRYRIFRHAPLTRDFRTYLKGIARWFVCEEAPYLAQTDLQQWLHCFMDDEACVLDQEGFCFEETEYLVTGIWPRSSTVCYCDMHIPLLTSTSGDC
jgi:ubiquinone/menaquinone biosynthesis C-methylase UbiE